MQQAKHILITGASSGIGRALALHYAAPGVFLALGGRSNDRLQEVAVLCRARGAQVEVSVVDVVDAAAMQHWISHVDARYPLTLVIANAGISGGSGGGTIHGEPLDQAKQIMATNWDGVMNTVAPIVAPMMARGVGQIALMSSLAGLRGMPTAPAYSTSKAAVRAYGEALRGWLAPKGVRVSVICPGFVQTPLIAKNPFPMPWIQSPERAAALIARGLEANRPRIAFPWQLYYPMLVASQWLPLRLSDWFFSRLPAKPATLSEEV